MRYFYAILLYLAEFEYSVAKETGRNPANVEKIGGDISRWQHALLIEQIGSVR